MLLTERDVSISYKYLSALAEYDGELMFTAFVQPPQDFLDHIGVKRTPKLVAFSLTEKAKSTGDFASIETTEFSSDFTYNNIRGFADFVS